MERLQKLLDNLLSQKPIQQVIMSIESRDGSFRWSGATGKAVDGSRVVPKTPYFIASIDKLYNATIVIKLAEQGKLKLEDPPELLYLPFGLRHTYFPGASQPLDLTPAVVPLHADGQIIEIPDLMRSIRGIYSTADDTIKFLRALSCGEVFQKPESFAHMYTRWNRFGFPMDRAALRSPGWPIEYGLGLMRFQLPRLFTALKRLPTVMGHTGSTGCWLFWCPETDLFFSGSVDEASAGAVPYRLLPQMLNVLAT